MPEHPSVTKKSPPPSGPPIPPSLSPPAGSLAAYGEATGPGSSWWSALLASSGLYVAIGAGLVVLGSATREIVREREVDLTFTEKIVAPEPPPPPPPPAPAPAPVPVAPPPVAAPPVPKNVKVRKVEVPPPVKPLAAPKEIPLEAPKEADPSEDKGVAVVGNPADGGDPAGREGGLAGSLQAGPAIALPEEADPPVPLPSNVPPTYPAEARAEGRTGLVILKVVIRADGAVAEVERMRGEEPFVQAAIEAVRSWRYRPARFEGRAITVYRIIQIPFRLNA